MPLQIDLRSAVFALSDALDLVGVTDFQHGKRVGMVARATAHKLQLAEADQDNVFCACLLHDLGVSSTTLHRRLVESDDPDDQDRHCRRAEELLRPFAHLSRLAPAIRWHHTPWTDLPAHLETSQALAANLILLADRVDSLLLRGGIEYPLFQRSRISDEIAALSGVVISPDLVRAFLAVAENEAFWISLAPRHVQLYLSDIQLDAWRVNIDFPRFHDVALLVSSIVDAKSHFTASHSLGVARLSRRLAERVGLPEDTCASIEIAGLMHDVGKLCVPDEIVDKPARLTPREFVLMERHSFETYQIVRHVPGLEQIAEWAAFHHEKLDGRGYPFRRSGDELSLEPRIVAVADVFQALSQARPYRRARPIEQIGAMLQQFVGKGHLDRELVAAVEDDLEGCWTAAVEPSTPPS